MTAAQRVLFVLLLTALACVLALILTDPIHELPPEWTPQTVAPAVEYQP